MKSRPHTLLTCLKCAYFWYQRGFVSDKVFPARCPKCKRTTWRQPDTFIVYEHATEKFYRIDMADLKQILASVRSRRL